MSLSQKLFLKGNLRTDFLELEKNQLELQRNTSFMYPSVGKQAHNCLELWSYENGNLEIGDSNRLSYKPFHELII